MSRAIQIGLLAALVALVAAPAHALAHAGDVLVGGDDGANTILRIKPNGHHQTVASGGPLTDPAGIDFAPNGTIFAADYGLTGVVSVAPGAHVAQTVHEGTPFGEITDVVRGPDGMLYAADNNFGDIWRLSPSGGTPVPLTTETPSATAVTLDGHGNLLVGGDGVFKVNLKTGATHLVTGTDVSLVDVSGIARTPGGDVYVEDNNGVSKLNLATGGVTPVASGGFLDTLYDFDVRPNGKILVAADSSPHARIVQVDPKSGHQKVIPGGTLGNAAAEGLRIEPPSCGGKVATIVGSTKSDHLKGTKFDDVIAGLGARDVIDGGGGKDIICGGGGKDNISGGGGKDTINGGPGHDSCIGERLTSC